MLTIVGWVHKKKLFLELAKQKQFSKYCLQTLNGSKELTILTLNTELGI